MNTNELIEHLAKNATPVLPLPRPGRRAAAWVLAAAVYVAVFTALMLQPGADVSGARFWLPQLAAIATGICAAAAAFASVVPGYSKRAFVWPLIAVLVWAGVLLAGSAGAEPASILGAQHEWLCVGLILVGGAPLLAVLTVMLRRGAPLNPALTAVFAALAVGALANVGACASQPHASDAVTLAWHGSAIAALVLACAWAARLVFSWNGRRARA